MKFLTVLIILFISGSPYAEAKEIGVPPGTPPEWEKCYQYLDELKAIGDECRSATPECVKKIEELKPKIEEACPKEILDQL